MRVALKNRFTSLRFRIWAAIICSTLMSLIFIASLFQTRMSDRPLQVTKITREKLAEFGPFTAKVNCGLYVLDFPTFDVLNANFTISCSLSLGSN